MKQTYTTLLVLFMLGIYQPDSHAQFVVAQDTIRGGIDFCPRPGDLNNSIQIPNDTVFYLFPPDMDIDPWRHVDMYLPNRRIIKGYIRGNDMMRVDDYDMVEVERLSSHGTVSFKDKNVKVSMSVADVSPKELANKQSPNGNYYINGKKARGIPRWGYPRLKYKSIQVSIKGRSITVPKRVYEHLFEPEIDNMAVYYNPQKEIVYIVANNGGADAYYKAMWAISMRRVANVYVFDP